MLDYEDLHWCSDNNGYEVGYDDVLVVGLYSLKVNPEIHFYIDVGEEMILEAFCLSENHLE